MFTVSFSSSRKVPQNLLIFNQHEDVEREKRKEIGEYAGNISIVAF